MKQSEHINRDFKLSDATMLGKANIIVEIAKEDLAEISEFDDAINLEFLNTYKARISDCQKMGTHISNMNLQSQQSVILAKQFELAKKEYHKLQYYVSLAFPNNPSMSNKFGSNEYAKVRAKVDKFIGFMQILSESIVQYKDELALVGYSEKQIKGFNAQFVDLEKANTAHGLSIIEGIKLTHDRIEELNSIYQIALRICKVGSIVFANNAAKKQRYVFYDQVNNKPIRLKFIIEQEIIKPLDITLKGKKEKLIVIEYGDENQQHCYLIGMDQTFNHKYAKKGKYTVSLRGDLVSLNKLGLANSQITDIKLAKNMTSLEELDLSDNHLSEKTINHLLISLDKLGHEKGKLNYSGINNHAPTELGLIALEHLKVKGWGVIG